MIRSTGQNSGAGSGSKKSKKKKRGVAPGAGLPNGDDVSEEKERESADLVKVVYQSKEKSLH